MTEKENRKAMKKIGLVIGIAMMVVACGKKAAQSEVSPFSEKEVAEVVNAVWTAHPEADSARVERGIKQAAALWRNEDGSLAEFTDFAVSHTAENEQEREVLYNQLARIWEKCSESADMLTVELLKPTQLTDQAEPGEADWIMSAYSPMAHFSDDMYANKMAFLTILNFPHYSLKEKNEKGGQWTRYEWAAARMGDMFTTRVPAWVEQEKMKAYADAENYTSDYNIYMGALLTEDDRRLWGEDVVLLSHWNLRDELKANYVADSLARERQEMIYKVMLHIVEQTIPASVINKKEDWKPFSNTCADNTREKDVRYGHILNHYHAFLKEDSYCPQAPTAIIRNFEESIEMPLEQVDSLFRALLSAEEVGKVANIIAQRLGRELRPYDIWYDGFKSRASLDQEALAATTRALYPEAKAFEKDMPRMLQALGFDKEKAEEICRHIVVEPARGSGHAWPALGRQEPARLRTRIAKTGMDYKGYNIAVHEFGHNVEQVVDLYGIDYYTLAGVPNTAFTEASAFLFQGRDIALLPKGSVAAALAGASGVSSVAAEAAAADMEALDAFWSMYEIMGVSLVDMAVWKWLYAHPEADAAGLREAVCKIAGEIWDEYYAPILGEKGCPLLAIYTHMVDVPMYLPNYPIGHVVEFQLEDHMQKVEKEAASDGSVAAVGGASAASNGGTAAASAAWAKEYLRIYGQGRLTPNHWLYNAVGATPSIEPVLESVREALGKMEK